MKDIVVKGNVYVEQSSLKADKALRVFRSLSEIDAGTDSVRCRQRPASCFQRATNCNVAIDGSLGLQSMTHGTYIQSGDGVARMTSFEKTNFRGSETFGPLERKKKRKP
jgi:hypothetical protein